MKKSSSYFRLVLLLSLVSFVTFTAKANAKIIDQLTTLSGTYSSIDTLIKFENEQAGSIPAGWTNVYGSYIVRQEANNKILSQVAENKGMDFNVAVMNGAILKDVELSVDIRAISGAEDQGGGLVWRYVDNNNYYIVRFNPLEDNFRLYKVFNGKRIQLASSSIAVPKGSWFNIRVVMKGAEITCYLNEKELISKSDDTFTKAGKTGFWTKADAVSDFDKFNINGD